MIPLILHIDMDAFFAAVEQRDHPELRGQPVIIGALPGHRGVVSTCSYEARKFGVRSAMPINEAYRRCPQGIYLRGDGQRYSSASAKVMAILGDFSPLVEQVSIDEAYVDISGTERLLGEPRELGQQIKDRIQKELQLPASIGIGPNRLIAKLASEHDKPDGLCVVTQDQVLDFLAPLPVAALRGVGPKLQQQLKAAGLHDVVSLRRWPLAHLQQRFGPSLGQMLYNQARGIGSQHVGETRERKQISKETTFAHDVSDADILQSTLHQLAAQVARKARAKGFLGRVVSLKIRFAGFETHSRQRRLAQGINSDLRLAQEAWRLYLEGQFAQQPVRLIGLGLSDWQTAPPQQQLGLFSPPAPDTDNPALYSALDQLKDRFGASVIGFASGLHTKKTEPKNKK